MKMRHVTIQSAKYEESIKFYQEIVGLTIVNEIKGKGPHDITFLANGEGETCIEIIDDKEAGFAVNAISVGFEAADVDAYREELVAKGIPCSPMIAPNPFTKFFFTKDPNGLDIQFING
ncbi:MAG: VOC family protein [Firmicutes bacterium]|nr:VOC family protein [Bacillota bacterium]